MGTSVGVGLQAEADAPVAEGLEAETRRLPDLALDGTVDSGTITYAGGEEDEEDVAAVGVDVEEVDDAADAFAAAFAFALAAAFA